MGKEAKEIVATLACHGAFPAQYDELDTVHGFALSFAPGSAHEDALNSLRLGGYVERLTWQGASSLWQLTSGPRFTRHSVNTRCWSSTCDYDRRGSCLWRLEQAHTNK
eukprot:208196-Amphidinium_carterae.1